jgi:hypothetical protein
MESQTKALSLVRRNVNELTPYISFVPMFMTMPFLLAVLTG